MASQTKLSFIAFCLASGICGALSAACGKAAGQAEASPFIKWGMYAAMLTVRVQIQSTSY